MKTEYTDGFFNVSGKHGFLPIRDPDTKLPDEYKFVQILIDTLPELLSEPGLIEKTTLDLPNFSENVSKETDPFVLQALYRAYTFLTSGYLLSPSHHTRDLETGKYGKAHQLLPKTIAQPLCIVAEKLDVYPWIDYHYSYSLGNYVRKNVPKDVPKDNTKSDLHWENLEMACSFSGTSDEIGFIMNHVYINELSPLLVGEIFTCLSDNDGNSKKSFGEIRDTFRNMNARRQTMWKASNPKNYNNFRTFIMGIKGNTEIFGDGVVYEGVSEEPRQYRGQSGAMDDIIPCMDIFSGVVDRYPQNMLTSYLLDLRTYRPKCVQEFFHDLREHSPVFLEKVRASRELSIILLQIMEQIYLFRNGHWQFVQKYIMANTKYENATGGTPITSWIPNQIEAVLKSMLDTIKHIDSFQDKSEDGELEAEYARVGKAYSQRVNLLHEQLEELANVNYNVEKVYNLNGETDINIEFK
jgi:indoleamine 2,3-dioxygenase